MNTFPTLYKKDSKGKTRIWFMEVDDARYRTTAGLQDGKKVTSDWTTAFAMNIGRSNETTAEEQAIAEVEAQYKKKLSVDYHENLDDIEVAKVFKPMLAVDYEKRKTKMMWTPETMIQPKLDGCVSGDTLVETEKGIRRMSDVVNGDDEMVLSYNITSNKKEMRTINGRFVNAHDISVDDSRKLKWLKLHMEDGSTITVTENHRIFIPSLGVWREARDLVEGSEVLSIN